MIVSKANIADLVGGLQIFKELFVPTDFDLVGGATISVGCYVVRRVMRGSDLSGGMVQYETLALVDMREWDEASPGRPPRKNDVVDHQGRRLAIEEVTQHAPADEKLMYRCRIRG